MQSQSRRLLALSSRRLASGEADSCVCLVSDLYSHNQSFLRRAISINEVQTHNFVMVRYLSVTIAVEVILIFIQEL